MRSNTSANMDLVAAMDSVSLGLYGAAGNLTGNGNLMISPLSILYSAVLLYLGANGRTKENLFSSLHFKEAFNNRNSDIADVFGNFLGELKLASTSNTLQLANATKNNTNTLPRHRNQEFQLALANGIFVQDGLELDKDYLGTVNQKLKSAVMTENFIKNPDGARMDINKWTEERTGGKIKNLIPPGAVDMGTRAVLANAVYFKASWQHIFDDFLTKNGTFHLLNNTESTVKLMFINKRYKYIEDSNLDIQYLEIPYMRNQASMLVFLPRQRAGLRNLENVLSYKKLQELARTVKLRDVMLRFPKFHIEGKYDLISMMQKIGVKEVFTDDADLTGIVPAGNVKVGSAFHKTFIDVDERGTEAAASSASSIQTKSIEIDFDSPVEFTADHPFIFAIRHNPTKLLIFMGRLENV